MGNLLQLRIGHWTKTDEGVWMFVADPGDVEHYVVAKTNEHIDSLKRLVQEEFSIQVGTPMVLTYQLPQSMQLTHGPTSTPHTLLTSGDVEMMMSVQEWTNEVQLCVTHGSLRVAKYQFLCRSPFTFGDETYLAEGITEEQHLSSINALVGDDEIDCNRLMLQEIFTEENLVIVYRFSMEVDKARRTLDLNRRPTNEVETEGLGGIETHSHHAPTPGYVNTSSCGFNDDVHIIEDPCEFSHGWEGMNFGPNFWEPNTAHGSTKEDPVNLASGTSDNIINLADQLNIDDDACPINEYTILDLDGSSTGSTENSPPITRGLTLSDPINIATFGGHYGSRDGDHSGMSAGSMEPGGNVAVGYGSSNPERKGRHSAKEKPHTKIIIEDASSEVIGFNGGTQHNPDVIYAGMVFRNRDDFKQHVAMYAIRNKFRFRNSRSSPGVMVIRCFSRICQWKVYAVLLKNTDLYEVRSVDLHHSCTVDDRAGYQTQATHTVIGGMMKARFAGRGGGPRPNDIMQAMQGDHHVNISYWKAWRSREVALDYAKGPCGASYNLLPGYLEKLVAVNPGTIADIHTEYAEGIGHRFKYMFLAMAASIEGYKSLRKVVIVDGTHLRGKYAGCLLTASAQDGNYQVFPLAVAVVDSENDKAWEWFFKKLTEFIPNNSNVVFVSDRHPSIYYALAKIYPLGRHCACILHLKRNIRTHFKDKHLGYLVGKAARTFRLSDFYTTFAEIKRVNEGCADYLIGIGVEHWARSHFIGNRYNVMTSNVAETWNSVLREAREFPILSLIEYIRAKLMEWFANRREITVTGEDQLTPRIHEIVMSNFERSGGFRVSAVDKEQYEVRDKEGDSFHVNLGTKTCTCFEFQTLMIPCTHAIAAATWAKVRINSLVSECYTLHTYRTAYSRIIAPVVATDSTDILSANKSTTTLNVNPPASRRPPGRPRKNRILSRGEFQGPRKRTMCSRCKCSGHNRATCKMAI